MKKTIENDYLLIEVQEEGAELCSIYNKQNGREYMWDANPDIWGSYSPVLFPIVGRVKDFKYRFQNKEYEIPQHGIVRRNFNCFFSKHTDNSVAVSLKSDEKTKEHYPFDFEFEIEYQLNQDEITVQFKVKNTGYDKMYFSLGGHPAFACPIVEDESLEDYYIEFSENEILDRWPITDQGTISKHPVPYLKEEKRIGLTKDLFDEDALVFKNMKSDKVSLKSFKSNVGIEVEMKDFPYLGLWSKPKANFVCIEPWQGIADSEDFNGELTEKEGVISLGKEKVHAASYKICIL